MSVGQGPAHELKEAENRFQENSGVFMEDLTGKKTWAMQKYYALISTASLLYELCILYSLPTVKCSC